MTKLQSCVCLNHEMYLFSTSEESSDFSVRASLSSIFVLKMEDGKALTEKSLLLL